MDNSDYCVIANQWFYNAVSIDEIFFEGPYEDCLKLVEKLRADETITNIRVCAAIYDCDFSDEEEEAA